MSKFKVWDKVKCVNNDDEDGLLIGHEYEVVFAGPFFGYESVVIKGMSTHFCADRFVLASPPAHHCPLCSGPCGALPPFTPLEQLATHRDVAMTRARLARQRAEEERREQARKDAGELKRIEGSEGANFFGMDYQDKADYVRLTGTPHA